MLVDLIAATLVLIGGAFALIGSIGLARLPDVFARLHGPTKATTLGVGALVMGWLVFFSARDGILTLREFTITLFLFMTAPVSAHMIAKLALKEKEGGLERE